MKSSSEFKILSLIILTVMVTSFTIKKTQVHQLVTEYKTNAIGIDAQKPRLSWQLNSDEENIMQTAYEIRVANSEENLKDGSSEIIESDSDWKASYGPILESDMYNGEKYDARLEMEGWANTGFDDSEWTDVEIVEHSKDILVAPQGPPVEATEEPKPVEQITTPKGEVVLDMSQNMVGWPA